MSINLNEITYQNVQDIMSTAEYGGITYWATQPNDAEFDARPAGKEFTIVEGVDDYPFGRRQVDEVFYLDADDIRKAFGALLDLDQEYVNRRIHGYILSAWIERDEVDGIDCGEIDADAADAIVQVACFGELRYG